MIEKNYQKLRKKKLHENQSQHNIEKNYQKLRKKVTWKPVTTQRNPETTISDLKRTYQRGFAFALRQILIKFHIHCAGKWHTSVDAHFDGPIADGSDCAADETNQGCSRVPKLAIHTSALRYAEATSPGLSLTLPPVYSWLKSNYMRISVQTDTNVQTL